MIATALADSTVPHAQVKQLARDWCGKGPAVRYLPVGLTAVPGDRDRLVLHHLAGMVLAYPTALAWMTERLSGAAAPSSCSSLAVLP
jgi:hypothetical protein